MIRIDPTTLVVDTSDHTGASSVGTTHEVSGNGTFTNDYTAMPFASARSCDDATQTTPFGNVDLTGTSFAVSSTQAWNLQGFSNNGGPFGGATLDTPNKKVSLTVGGFPAGLSPCNDYYTTTGGTCLQLVYSP
jgi:hypothetical protein